MDRSTLGHNLRPLERDGLIRLAVDSHDRRTCCLDLTAQGKAKLAASRPHWQRAQERFEESYGALDAKQLRGSLRRVVESAVK